MLLVIVLPMRVSTPAAWGLPAAGFAALSYAVLLASAFNYFAYAWAARRSNASTVTAFFPLQVVFAAILQVLILGEYPTPEQLVGAAAIVVALFCIVASLASDSGVESPKASAAGAAAVVAEAESPEE
jgi:drug/metabolite transporter (DMT)-like permease